MGNIYLGRVCRVLPGMQSAFVEIGLARAAFLHVADIWMARNGDGQVKPIEKILSEGQTLLVQVVKDPIGTKGARLSTQVSIAGRLLVYLPQDPHIGISQRIEDVAERENLREKVHSLIPPGESGRLHRAHRGRDRDRRGAARPTSTTSSRCGSRSSRPPRPPRPRRCSTRTSSSPRACCATS